MSNLLDFIQGASNSAASNVSAPVDGINWLLRKAGLPVSNKPFLGSDWMAQQGLTREPQNKLAGLLGESVGGIAPIVAAAKAPQIAKGLLGMGENAAIPQTLNRQAGVILYHGSNDQKPITEINKYGTFGGLFTSPSKMSAQSHGNKLYRMTVPDNQVMQIGEDLPWDSVRSVIQKNTKASDGLVDDIAEMVSDGRSAFSSSIPEDDLMAALRASDIGEADWELQRLRGLVARENGFKAVAMPDEHGMSYLVLPGTKPRPANQSSKDLFRK